MNTTNNSDRLKAAAEAGNIDLLYTVIQDDPYILDRIDLIPFVETPLHTAASMGHLQFATEIMNLKPSFALKLNQQGFSPIHLAMQNNQEHMVYRFVFINEDLVKVKGREGLTPLHFASQIGEIEILAHFLILCSESIEYLTVRRETALHIAVKNGQYEALKVLVGWLRRNTNRGAKDLEYKILNRRDEEHNTILHISALSSDPQLKNLENETALDLASTPEMKSILLSFGAKPSLEVSDAPKKAHILMSKTTIVHNMRMFKIRISRNIAEDERNTWMIVVTLVATAIYQSGLSPPGGIYQVSATNDNGPKVTSSNSTTIFAPGNAGKSVLSGYEFTLFLFVNIYSFSVSVLAILLMIPLPSRTIAFLVASPMGWFIASYLFSMWRISPTHVISMILFIVFGTFLVAMVIDFSFARYSMLKHRIARIFKASKVRCKGET